MADEFALRNDDARALFEWIIKRYDRAGNLVARHEGEGWGAI
jgi:hypothetical protein